MPVEQHEANARLIAAAPAMLEALRRIARQAEVLQSDTFASAVLGHARHALALATGGDS